MTIEAWYMDDSSEDQRLEHRQSPNIPVSLEELSALGVLHWNLDADNHENDPELKKIRADRGYDYSDSVTCTPACLPNYDEKLKIFFQEHIHEDEEIRYCLEGSGYFDVRDLQDKWIRIRVEKGDMIVLPEGIYHRFTMDENNFIKAMRLFKGVPVWTPINRPQDEHESRIKYVEAFGKNEVEKEKRKLEGQGEAEKNEEQESKKTKN